MPPSVLSRVRKLCLSLPNAHEVEAWGEPTFRVQNKVFAMYASASNHHGAGHHAIWVNCTPASQGFMIADKPARFFSPPYCGPYGWIGVRLDGRINWKELAEILRDGYELTAAKLKRPRAERKAHSTRKPTRSVRGATRSRGAPKSVVGSDSN